MNKSVKQDSNHGGEMGEFSKDGILFDNGNKILCGKKEWTILREYTGEISMEEAVERMIFAHIGNK